MTGCSDWAREHPAVHLGVPPTSAFCSESCADDIGVPLDRREQWRAPRARRSWPGRRRGWQGTRATARRSKTRSGSCSLRMQAWRNAISASREGRRRAMARPTTTWVREHARPTAVSVCAALARGRYCGTTPNSPAAMRAAAPRRARSAGGGNGVGSHRGRGLPRDPPLATPPPIGRSSPAGRKGRGAEANSWRVAVDPGLLVAPAALPSRGERCARKQAHSTGSAGGRAVSDPSPPAPPGCGVAPSGHGRTSGAYRLGIRALLACGGDLEVVQEQLGHASIKTTTIYAKVTKEDKVRAADALAKAYRSSQQNRETGASWRRRVPVKSGRKEESVASS